MMTKRKSLNLDEDKRNDLENEYNRRLRQYKITNSEITEEKTFQSSEQEELMITKVSRQ